MSIENKNIIDLISGDLASPRLRLIMLEEGEWEMTPERLEQLEGKISTYYNYVMTGQLAQDRPSEVNLPIFVELHCAHKPPKQMIDLFRQVGDLLEKIRAVFVVYHVEYDDGERSMLKVFDSRGLGK